MKQQKQKDTQSDTDRPTDRQTDWPWPVAYMHKHHVIRTEEKEEKEKTRQDGNYLK